MGLLDGLGGLSPGDGYVDASTPVVSSGANPLVNLWASLLGPTQAQQKMTDAATNVNPQIVDASPQDVATAQMLGAGTGAPYGFGSAAIPQQVAQSTPAAPAIQAPAVTPSLFNVANNAAPAASNLSIAAPTGAPDVSVAPDGTASDGQGAAPADPSGGLLGSLSQAAQDPDQSKGLLQSFGEQAKAIGDKLTNLSPNASQALLASGLTMLAGNDGRHNLGQIVGEGGIAGINNYQTNVQRQMANTLAAAKLNQENNLKLRQQALQEWTAANKVDVVAPGSSITTLARTAAGQAPISSGQSVKEYIDQQNPDGTVSKVPVDYNGNVITSAPAITTKDAWTQPLNDSERTAVNGYQTQVDTGKQDLNRLQGYISQLSPTMKDAQGNTVPNPNFVSVPGGLAAHASQIWTNLTGDQTNAQQLRQQIQQDVTKSSLGSYKAGVGGRLTNADIGMLQKGLPTDTGDGQALYNYLSKYTVLKANEQGHTEAQAAFASANRGSLGATQRPINVNGQAIPVGTSFADFEAGKLGNAPAQSGTAAVSAPAAGAGPNAILMQVRAAARNGDASAIAALKQRGISY